MKTKFLALLDKAIYYWARLLAWANPNMPRWALAMLVAAGLAGWLIGGGVACVYVGLAAESRG